MIVLTPASVAFFSFKVSEDHDQLDDRPQIQSVVFLLMSTGFASV